MKLNGTQHQPHRQKALRAIVAFACALSLTGCVAGTPLEGTPLEGPLNQFGEMVQGPLEQLGQATEGPREKIGQFMEGPLSKFGELADRLFGGTSVADARAAKATENAPALDADQLVLDGYLTVGLPIGSVSAPFIIQGEAGKVTGIDVDVASAVAGNLGLMVRFVPVKTADEALSAGICDVVMDASADRVSSATVLGGYYETSAAFFRVGDAGVVSVDELDGKKVAVQTGSVSQSILDSTALKMEQSPYGNLNEAFEALVAGDVDYVLCDAYPGAFLAASYGDVSFAGSLSAPAQIGIAAAANASDLQTAVKEALDTVTANGQMDVIRTSWVGGMQALTIEDSIVNVPMAPKPETENEGEGEESDEPQDGSTAGANAVIP